MTHATTCDTPQLTKAPSAFQAIWEELQVALAALFASAAWRRVAFFLLPYVGLILGLDLAAHYGAVTDAPLPSQFFISQDRGFGEFLEYSLTAASALMLGVLWWRSREAIYLVLSGVFAFLTLDNSLEFHERFGHKVAPYMPQGTPLPANDIGELLLFLSIGLALAVSYLMAMHRSRLRPLVYGLVIGAGIAGAAFFGIVADVITSWGIKSDELIEFEAWIEDGGEFGMIILTFLATLAIYDTER